MKKLCVLLSLVLALACVPALASNDVLLTPDSDVVSYTYIFNDGETIYMSSYSGISVWQPGDKEAKYYPYETPDHDNTYLTAPFLSEGELFAVRVHPSEEDGEKKLDGAAVCAMKLEGSEATFEQRFELDWKDITYETDAGTEINMPSQMLEAGGQVFMTYYDTDNFGARVGHLARLDMEEEKVEVLDSLENVWQITPYEDGKLLMLQREENDSDVSIRVYDPEEDDTSRFARLEVDDKAVLTGLAYNAEQEKAFLCLGNEVRPVNEEDEELGDSVADLPIQYLDIANHALFTEDGSYVYCGRNVAVMDLSGESAERQNLIISDSEDNGALDVILQDFQIRHSNVRVRVNHNQDKIDNLVENLINQDDSIDIYLLSTSMPVYTNLRNRGFMTSLESNQTISALVGGMYPEIQNQLTSNGHIVALPLDTEILSLGFSKEALGLVDLDLNSVPTNWNDFLDFLPTLVEPLKDNDKVRLSFSYETIANVRSRLFDILFLDYQTYMNRVDPEMGYDTELLRNLLQKLDKVDFEAMGFFEDEEDAEENSNDAKVIMDAGLDCAFNSEADGTYQPVLMGMDANNPGCMVMKLKVAFVNPYSRNMEAAMAFMETLAESMPNRVRYSLIPDLNTPVRGAAEEAQIREFEDSLKNLYAQLEKAEGAKRNLIQDQIDALEEDKAQAVANSWEISQRKIDWYRANADHLTMAPANWLDAESRSLIEQFCQGKATANEILQRIDQKVRMMRMEGN